MPNTCGNNSCERGASFVMHVHRFKRRIMLELNTSWWRTCTGSERLSKGTCKSVGSCYNLRTMQQTSERVH